MLSSTSASGPVLVCVHSVLTFLMSSYTLWLGTGGGRETKCWMLSWSVLTVAELTQSLMDSPESLQLLSVKRCSVLLSKATSTRRECSGVGRGEYFHNHSRIPWSGATPWAGLIAAQTLIAVSQPVLLTGARSRQSGLCSLLCLRR